MSLTTIERNWIMRCTAFRFFLRLGNSICQVSANLLLPIVQDIFHLVKMYYLWFICCRRIPRLFSDPLFEFVIKYQGPTAKMQKACVRLINVIISKHQLAKRGKCPRGKAHSDLYLAARIAFACRMPFSSVVGDILQEIYGCEKSFLRFFAGKKYTVDGEKN